MRWSVLERQCVYRKGEECEPGAPPAGSTFFDQPRDWNDTFAVRAGLSKWLSKPVEVFAGLGYASSAVPDHALEPALPDWHSVSVSLGGRFEVFEKMFVAAGYTQLFYIPRDTSGEFDLDDEPGASKGPDAGGNYKQLVGVLNVNVDMQF
jgi:long-chain fatty acid transport protein